MTSDEGLNAYGAVTWGQFFVYQGFNERAGWMHTSSGVDNIDEYLGNDRARRATALFYRYGTEERPVKTCTHRRSLQDGGGMATQGVHRLPHAPRADRPRGGRQVGERPADAGAAEGADPVLHADQGAAPTRRSATRWSCTPTRRTTRSSPTPTATSPTSTPTSSRGATRASTGRSPVDGSDPATEWNGVLSVDETPGLLNPASGWLYNTNNWPWSAAGASSPKKADLPRLRGERRREPARRARHPRPRRQEGLHDRLADRGAGTTATCRSSRSSCPPLLKA